MRTLFLVSLLMASAPALALDMTQPVLDADGKAAHEGKAFDSPVLTLGAVVSSALFAPPLGSDGKPSQFDALRLGRRAALALRLRDAKAADISAEEVIEIKDAIRIFPPLTVLRVLQAVDPAALK